MKQSNNFLKDYVKACRRQAREEEIETYGKPLHIKHVTKSKKQYDRRKFKRWDE
jgi:hypothetical protein